MRMRVQLLAVLIGAWIALNSHESHGQQPTASPDAVVAAVRMVVQQMPESHRVKLEVRGRDNRFDASRSTAVAAVVSRVETARREDVLVCPDIPSSCRLAGADALVSVGQTATDGDKRNILIEVLESRPANKLQPVYMMTLLVTVEQRANGTWVGTSMRMLSET